MTTKEQSLERLIERVKAATEYDAELEAAIWLAVVPGASRRNVMANFAGEDPIWEYHDPERNTCARFIPSIMRSFDAALALVERCLPGRAVAMGLSTNPSPYCGIAPSTLEHAPTLPLAILAALLTALKDASE